MIILKSDHAIPYVCQFALQDEERALHIDNKNASLFLLLGYQLKRLFKKQLDLMHCLNHSFFKVSLVTKELL